MSKVKYILWLCLLPIFFSCSTTKYVPDNEYLLNKVNIEVVDQKVRIDNLKEYVRQEPNENMLFFPKFRLHLYSLSGKDTSRWMNRLLRKIGTPPVIYDSTLMTLTEKQLKQEMENQGYLNAQIFHCISKKKKKLDLSYCIKANERYLIRHFSNGIENKQMALMMRTRPFKRAMNLEKGDPFVSEELDNISEKVTSIFRNQGYYNLSKENFYFLVDTAVGKNRVDVTLKYRALTGTDSSAMGKDPSLLRYRIRNVIVIDGYDQFDRQNRLEFERPDTSFYKGIKVVYGKHPLIRPSVLYYNNFIRPGRFYSDRLLENSYSSFNSLAAVSQANIQFKNIPDTTLLDAYITLSPANIYYFQFGIDGTNTAGDFGAASYVSFQNKNLFRGSETFKIRLNGAYEYINANETYDVLTDNYYEYGGDISLSTPRILFAIIPEKYRQQVGASTTFLFNANWRKRPEYQRRFLSLNWRYNWKTLQRRFVHTFDLYNINYVVTPWTSQWFEDYLNREDNVILKESYKDQFITRTSYSFVFTSNFPNQIQTNGFTLRGSAEVAGTLPYLMCNLFDVEKSNDVYDILGTPFAQYFRVSGDITKLFSISKKNTLAAHFGFGLGYPYGNSEVIPYEQRFFAGGSNSVRGWGTRTLGPGTYESKGSSDFLNQTGDIKLLWNLEYRIKTNSFLEFATFLDAGNVWTIKNYPNQPGGAFEWNSFLEELGFSWGVGVRPNFGFIMLRFDVGMKIYSPEVVSGTRWVITDPQFWESFAFHFAVGYPF